MTDYKKLYCLHFGFDYGDFIPSEISGLPAVDIHHIENRKMGGTKKENRIENLIALTRQEHEKYGDQVDYKAQLYKTHQNHLKTINKPYNEAWLKAQIEKYS